MRSVGPIFERDSGSRDRVANAVGRGPVFSCARASALLDEFLQQSIQRRSLRGEGRVAVMHGTVLPARVDSRGHSAREAVLTRPDGKPGALATETRWTTVLEDAPGAP